LVSDQRQADLFNRVTGEALTLVDHPLDVQQMQRRLLPALRRRGDAALRFVLAHQLSDGALTEQIHRDTGQPQGARNLTWAIAELVNTLALRG
jgi:GH15 family glucan-1,4-alpha-glucosidase